MVIRDLTPTFDWSGATPSVISYHLVVDNNTDFSSPEINVTIRSPTTEYESRVEFESGTYSWKVRATNFEGDGPFSETFTFIVEDRFRPGAVVLTSPANGALINDQTPLLDWTNSSDRSGIDRYTIQVATVADSFFDAPLIDTNIDGSPPQSSFTPVTNLPEGTYFWHVRARDGAGIIGLYSSTRSFTIDATGPAAAPTLYGPPNSARFDDNTPAFVWSDVADPTTVTYEFLLDTDSSFTIPNTISRTSLSDSIFILPTALSDGVYFWKVRATDAAGNAGPYSSIYSFTIDTVSPDTTINSRIDGNSNPVTNNGTTASNSITFSFSGTPSADVNYFQCSIDDSNYITIIGGSNYITCTSPTQFNNLTESTHTFRVRAVDALHNADQTPAEHRWTVDVTGPTVTASPATGTYATNQSVTLSSTATDLDAIYYITDGSTPDNTDTEYTGPISISSTTTLKFIGYDTLGNAGTVGTATYTIVIDNTGPTVTTSPATGTYATNQSVTLSSTATDLDAIYYITDGSIPDNTDTEYTTPISISSTTTLKFIGYDTLGNAGPVGTETYTIVVTPSDIDTSLSLKLSTSINIPHKLVPKSLHGLLDSAANIPITGGSKYTASGKLTDSATNQPISGKTITITTDGSTPVTATTNNKDIFTAQLTAPNFPGKHDIVASFAGDTQYNSSNSPVRKLVVIGVSHLTLLTLKLDSNIIMAPGSSYSASGKLVGMVGSVPLSGKTITITTDGSSPVSATTNNKGMFTVQLKAPATLGLHSIKAHFAGDSQHKSSDSPIVKVFVKGSSPALDKTASLNLRLEGKNKMTSDSTYGVTGKLIDALSKKPIPGKVISITTNDGSPKVTDTTDKKGEFEVTLKAPSTSGEYDIKAHFAGDSRYNPAESQVAKITVEENVLTDEKTNATTDEQETDEQEQEQETDEQEQEQETDEQEQEQETDELEQEQEQETEEQEQEPDEQE